MYTTLIEAKELATHYANPDWALLDCRFDLARPGWGSQVYSAGHIPCSIHCDLDRDLSGPVTAGSGRHPLPSPESLARTLSRWGIDGRVQVVAYDQNTGAYAARLWWLLRWLGHQRAAVLNGGFAAWQQTDLPVSTQPGIRAPRTFIAQIVPSAVVTTADVDRWVRGGELARGDETLLDARSADRFAGENETLDPVAGHVPGARNHPFALNLDANGRFLAPDALRVRWIETLRGKSPAQAVSMCGSGVTACHNLLALEAAGLPGARLYAGSWSEWIRDATRQIERGP